MLVGVFVDFLVARGVGILTGVSSYSYEIRLTE